MKNGFRHKKKLGQCFLKDKNIAEKIVRSAEIKEGEKIWEIGPGGGILTSILYEKATDFTAFEIDEELIPSLQERFPDLKIINKDILKVDWQKELEDSKIKIVTNLPYQITSPFLFKTAEFSEHIDCVVVMIQKEVADRIYAKMGTKDYGILSIKMQYYFEIDYITKVKRHLFIPQPNVDSAVIRLRPRIDKPKINNLKLFWKIVETSFRNRRKMLRVNLSQIIARDKLQELEAKSGIDMTRRGETLIEKEFIDLYNAFVNIQSARRAQ